MGFWDDDDAEFFELYWMDETLKERAENKRLREELEEKEFLEDELYESSDEYSYSDDAYDERQARHEEIQDLIDFGDYTFEELKKLHPDLTEAELYRDFDTTMLLTKDVVDDYDPDNKNVCEDIQDVIDSGFYTKAEILRMYRGLDEKALKEHFNIEKLIPEEVSSQIVDIPDMPLYGHDGFNAEGMSAEEFDSYMPENPPKPLWYTASNDSESEKGSEENTLRQSKAKKTRRIIIWSVIAALVIAAIVIIIVMASAKREAKRQALYDEAVEKVMQGNWWDTIDTFESLSKIQYKGARDFYLFCKGKKQYAEGDLKAAYKTVGQMMLKDVTAEQGEYLEDFFFELDHKYHRIYGYDLPASYKRNRGSNSSSSGSGKNSSSSGSHSSSSGSHSSSSGSHSSTKTDPYNAKDYANEEDFYEDYYNDFIDFDEAEEYWEEHN